MSPEEEYLISGANFPKGLSTFFAVVCIVDVFGVFPIVYLPRTIISCGLYGIVVIAIVCGAQIYTASLLGKCWMIAEEMYSGIEDKRRYPYSALAEITYGNKVACVVTCILDVAVFGGGIPNLLVAAQTVQLMTTRISDDTLTLSYCGWLIIIGIILCPMLWLGSPKDMKLVCTISAAMVGLLFILILYGVLTDDRIFSAPNMSLQEEKPLWEALLTAYGIVTFQFDIHPTVLTVQLDMKRKENIFKAIIGGYTVSIGMFILIAIAVQLKYGTYGIYLNILGNLPSTNILHLAALLVAVQLGMTCVVSNSALYQHIEECLHISREFSHKRCILRTSLIILAIVLAESVPKLDVIMALIGGTLIGPLTFILPPLFYLKLLKMKHATENFEFWICSIIIFFGLCGTVISTYLNAWSVINFSNFSQPCIYNLTSELSL